MKLSVIICTLNRSADLARTLAWFSSATDQPAFELIVVDQSSAPDAVAAATTVPPNCSFRYFHRKERGLSISRNFGTCHAVGDILIYVDDDVSIHEGFLAAHLEAYSDSSIDGVTGPVLSPGRHFRARAELSPEEAAAVDRPHATFICDVDFAYRPLWLPGCNMSFRRSALAKVGLFDPIFEVRCDDSEMSHRVRTRSGSLYYNPRAALVHLQNPSGGTRVGNRERTRSSAYLWQTTRSEICFLERIGERAFSPASLWRFFRRLVLNRTTLAEGKFGGHSAAFLRGVLAARRYLRSGSTPPRLPPLG